MEDGTEPVADDELLYRRIPASMGWYDAATGTVKLAAFGPHKTRDVTGLSVSRAKYKSAEEAAQGLGKSYYVAVLRYGDLRENDIIVVPRPDVPDGYDPAHAELPDMNAGNREEDATLKRKEILVGLCLRVEGPFESPESETT